ncbi:MAG TPA: hypothetical protein VHS09_13315, partial [Polyangiaceae bacterium]|nr:hypothetical protein [Polyangiaceae bacterium]
MTTSKRGRPPTGCPKWDADAKQWVARLLKPNGGRHPVAMPGIPEHDVERAHALAKQLATRAQEGGFVPDVAREVVNEWVERWAKARRAKGLRTVGTDLVRYAKWIAPVIGTKAIAELTRRDMEEIVQALDRAVRAGKMMWKTATNVWGVV